MQIDGLCEDGHLKQRKENNHRARKQMASAHPANNRQQKTGTKLFQDLLFELRLKEGTCHI
jgi:hypothetical protein